LSVVALSKTGMPSNAANRMLLQQLRIQPELRAPPPEPSRGRSVPVGALLLIGLVAGAVALTTVLLRGHRFEIEAVTAVTPWSDTGSFAILQVTGYVTAKRQATVSAQITGTLTEVLVDEGDRVKAGQVLARLDSTAQRAALAQSEAQFRVAQAMYAQSKAQLKQNYRDLVRNEDLQARRLVSMQALETARTQVETQAAQVESQRRQVDLAGANLKSARFALDQTIVRAPFAGVVIAQPAGEGEITSPMSPGADPKGSGVATIVDMDSLVIEVDVTEANLERVRAGQKVELVPDAYPGWAIPAHVIAVIPTADRAKATFKVRIGIDQKDPRILPDMGMRVSFLAQAPGRDAPAAVAQTDQSALKGALVPGSAIVEHGASSAVFVIDHGRVRERPVVPDQTYGDLRFVEGITSGAQVVKDPPADMKDGTRISIKARQ
jgi:RND family efflux transporter MFP subunit